MARIDIRAERVEHRARAKIRPADRDREQAAAAQDDEMIAVHFDDATFVDAGVLDIRNLVGAGAGCLLSLDAVDHHGSGR